MPRQKALTATVTPYPKADIREGAGRRSIDDTQWGALANDVWQTITTSYTAREALEQNLKLWTALYEMESPERDTPFVDSSNLFIPLVASKLEALHAQVVALTFVPEFYIITGLTPEAADHAYQMQAYWNEEFRKQRGRTTWFQEHVTLLHLSLRDGTAVMEVMWKHAKRRTRYHISVPKVGEDNQPVFGDDGELQNEVHTLEDEVIDYNDVVMRPVLLRDFMLVPDEAINIEDAVGCARAEWLYESDLRAMLADGLIREDMMERVLAYDPQGISDISSDRQGVYDRTAGGQLDIGQGQGPMGSEFFQNRGPFKIWRLHSRQFDMDGDGIPEENVFWSHELSMTMLGWCPDEYIAPTRPFFAFSPFPRPDRFYGYSLAERLGPFNAEANLIWNQRNDKIALNLWPPSIIDRTQELADKGLQWGPAKTWSVSGDPSKAIWFPQLPDIPLASFQQESLVRTDADTIAGLNQPMTGGQSSGRRSAAEVKISSSSAGIRANEIAMLLRLCARSILEFSWKLKLQYPWKPDPFGIPIDKSILAMPFKKDVSGTSDPLDKQAHVDEVLGAYNLLHQDPDVQGDAEHRYNLKRMLLEAIGIVNIEAIIGSAEEAAQRKQSEAQMNQQKMQMDMEMAKAKIVQMTHGKGVGPEPGPAGPAPPPQPSMNGAPPSGVPA